MKLCVIFGLLVLAAVVTAMPTEGEKGDLAELEHDMDAEQVLLKLWLKHHAKKGKAVPVYAAPAPVYAAPAPVYAAPVAVPVKVKKIKG